MTESIVYLHSLETRGIKLGLKRTQLLLENCNNPQKNLRCIQIAGTNGKGSVSAMISNALIFSGYKVGLYTSPHLINLNERIRINGIPISNLEISIIVKKYKKEIEKNSSSFFEAMTMIAFTFFKKNNVDIAILETGLGGKFDSVTTCFPEATVITPISMDHKEILGDTIEKIAEEKFGIIKNNIPIFSSAQKNKVKRNLKKRAIEKKAPLFICNYKDNIKPIFLKGKHQKENAQLAYDVISYLFKIDKKKIIRSIEKTKWHGRYQILQKNPLIIFDVGHNDEGIKSFLEEYQKEKIKGKRYLIIVLQNRKKINQTRNIINKLFDQIICSETDNQFSMKASKLATFFNKKAKQIKDINKAINHINQKLEKNDSLAIVGSHYLGKSIQRVYKNNFDKL